MKIVNHEIATHFLEFLIATSGLHFSIEPRKKCGLVTLKTSFDLSLSIHQGVPPVDKIGTLAAYSKGKSDDFGPHPIKIPTEFLELNIPREYRDPTFILEPQHWRFRLGSQGNSSFEDFSGRRQFGYEHGDWYSI